MVTFIFKVYKKLIKLFFLYIKILTGYYQKNKDKLSKKKRSWNVPREEEKEKKRQYACEQYRNRSEEEKEKTRQYGHERYKSLLEDEE